MSGWSLDDLLDEAEDVAYDGPRGEEAERLLAAAEELLPGVPPRAEYLRCAVWWLHNRGEHEAALRCVSEAIADGGPTWVDARVDELFVLLALGDPRADEVERALRRSLDQQPNVDIAMEMVADSLAEAGRDRDAARWYTLALGDLHPDEIEPDDGSLLTALRGRARARRRLGLPMDGFDHAAERVQHTSDERRRTEAGDIGLGADSRLLSMLWWPAEEFARLVERWPDLAEGYGGSAEGHRAETERHLRDYRDQGVTLRVGAGVFADFLALAEELGEDPRSGAARARYAAELGRTGQTVAWPPGRNDPCWCGSGMKYKRCCGSVTARR